MTIQPNLIALWRSTRVVLQEVLNALSCVRRLFMGCRMSGLTQARCV
jgi:hypothetical protein